MKVRFISVRFGSVAWNGGMMAQVEKRGKSRKKVEPAVVRSTSAFLRSTMGGHYGGQANDERNPNPKIRMEQSPPARVISGRSGVADQCS